MISEFEKEKVFWTRKMNLKLVNFMRSKPHIWNPKHSKYSSVALRDHTYDQFADKYGNQFSGRAVKERWTNIRSTFASYLRKLKAALAAGKEYKVNWHLWEACQFLLKVNKTVKHELVKAIDDLDSKDNSLPSEDFSDIEEKVDSSQITSINSDVTCRSLAKDLVSIFHSVQNGCFGRDDTRNGKVGRTVTEKLSQMSSEEAAKVSHQIMGILLKYEESNTEYNSNYND